MNSTRHAPKETGAEEIKGEMTRLSWRNPHLTVEVQVRHSVRDSGVVRRGARKLLALTESVSAIAEGGEAADSPTSTLLRGRGLRILDEDIVRVEQEHETAERPLNRPPADAQEAIAGRPRPLEQGVEPAHLELKLR